MILDYATPWSVSVFSDIFFNVSIVTKGAPAQIFFFWTLNENETSSAMLMPGQSKFASKQSGSALGFERIQFKASLSNDTTDDENVI